MQTSNALHHGAYPHFPAEDRKRYAVLVEVARQNVEVLIAAVSSFFAEIEVVQEGGKADTPRPGLEIIETYYESAFKRVSAGEPIVTFRTLGRRFDKNR